MKIYFKNESLNFLTDKFSFKRNKIFCYELDSEKFTSMKLIKASKYGALMEIVLPDSTHIHQVIPYPYLVEMIQKCNYDKNTGIFSNLQCVFHRIATIKGFNDGSTLNNRANNGAQYLLLPLIIDDVKAAYADEYVTLKDYDSFNFDNAYISEKGSIYILLRKFKQTILEINPDTKQPFLEEISIYFLHNINNVNEYSVCEIFDSKDNKKSKFKCRALTEQEKVLATDIIEKKKEDVEEKIHCGRKNFISCAINTLNNNEVQMTKAPTNLSFKDIAELKNFIMSTKVQDIKEQDIAVGDVFLNTSEYSGSIFIVLNKFYTSKKIYDFYTNNMYSILGKLEKFNSADINIQHFPLDYKEISEVYLVLKFNLYTDSIRNFNILYFTSRDFVKYLTSGAYDSYVKMNSKTATLLRENKKIITLDTLNELSQDYNFSKKYDENSNVLKVFKNESTANRKNLNTMAKLALTEFDFLKDFLTQDKEALEENIDIYSEENFVSLLKQYYPNQ